VRLTVPRRGGWRAWGAVRADFERALADPADPAVATAEIASELRRGADYVRVTIALTVITIDVADALAIAWDAFRAAARDDLSGWEVAATTAQVQPEPPLTPGPGHPDRGSWPPASGHAVRARGTKSPSNFIWVATASISPRSCPVIAIASWAKVSAMSSSARPYSPTSMTWCSHWACSRPMRSSRPISRPYRRAGRDPCRSSSLPWIYHRAIYDGPVLAAVGVTG
jgi:hypothetical protein